MSHFIVLKRRTLVKPSDQTKEDWRVIEMFSSGEGDRFSRWSSSSRQTSFRSPTVSHWWAGRTPVKGVYLDSSLLFLTEDEQWTDRTRGMNPWTCQTSTSDRVSSRNLIDQVLRSAHFNWAYLSIEFHCWLMRLDQCSGRNNNNVHEPKKRNLTFPCWNELFHPQEFDASMQVSRLRLSFVNRRCFSWEVLWLHRRLAEGEMCFLVRVQTSSRAVSQCLSSFNDCSCFFERVPRGLLSWERGAVAIPCVSISFGNVIHSLSNLLDWIESGKTREEIHFWIFCFVDYGSMMKRCHLIRMVAFFLLCEACSMCC